MRISDWSSDVCSSDLSYHVCSCNRSEEHDCVGDCFALVEPPRVQDPGGDGVHHQHVKEHRAQLIVALCHYLTTVFLSLSSLLPTIPMTCTENEAACLHTLVRPITLTGQRVNTQ